MNKSIVIGGVAGLLLLLAVGDFPYGYYTFLRWATTVAAIWLAVIASQEGKGGWLLFLIPLAILFNPIAPIFLTKEIWTPIDLLAASGMLLAGWQIGASARKRTLTSN